MEECENNWKLITAYFDDKKELTYYYFWYVKNI